MSRPDEIATPWARGRFDAMSDDAALLFGRMYEDPAVELSIFPPGSRIFAIASAGCTAMTLAAAGHDVTAVDINPAQIEYVRTRLAGGPAREGAADGPMRIGRSLLPTIGWSRVPLQTFLGFDDTEQQTRFYREHLDTARWRLMLRLLLGAASLRAHYSGSFLRSLPPRFDTVIRARFERGWRAHPNLRNPYAWRLLLGVDLPGGRPAPLPSAPPRLAHADAAEYLESVPPGSFDGLTLSNILDGADPRYGERLLTAARRAAAPGAAILLRSFDEPRNAEEGDLAARDRSLLWGRIRVERVIP